LAEVIRSLDRNVPTTAWAHPASFAIESAILQLLSALITWGSVRPATLLAQKSI
jgi:hypothetical protein